MSSLISSLRWVGFFLELILSFDQQISRRIYYGHFRVLPANQIEIHPYLHAESIPGSVTVQIAGDYRKQLSIHSYRLPDRDFL